MKITIRKAIVQDADLIAWAMLESSRAGKKNGVFDLIFETRDEAALLAYLKQLCVTQSKSRCHYTNFLVAETGDGAVGVLCGYEPRIATDESFSEALQELGIDESYHERISAYLLCKPETDKNTWVLDFMAEKSGVMSFEVIRELVQKSLLTARLKGYRKTQTMLEIGSVEALMAYKKIGFFVKDEKRSEYYEEVFGRPGIMRLQLNL